MRTKDDNGDRELRYVLLKRQIAIDSDENVVTILGKSEKVTVRLPRPTSLRNRADLVTEEFPREAPVYALVEQDPHVAEATTRAFASSRKAMTCSRFTVGNPSRKASIDSPPSRYSMRVCTGTRVPANTGVPPKISGEEVMKGFPMAE
jgi:hypothetical protein